MGTSAYKIKDEPIETAKAQVRNKTIAILEAAEDNDVESLKNIFGESSGSHSALQALFTLKDSSKRTPMHLVLLNCAF